MESTVVNVMADRRLAVQAPSCTWVLYRRRHLLRICSSPPQVAFTKFYLEGRFKEVQANALPLQAFVNIEIQKAYGVLLDHFSAVVLTHA